MGASKEKELPIPGSAFWGCSYRLFVTLMLCLGLLTAGLMRINMGMGMVCMVNGTALRLEYQNSSQYIHRMAYRNSMNLTSECGAKTQYNRMQYDGSLLWSKNVQGWIHSAFFYGSVFSSIPAGFLADRYGPKMIYLASIAVYICGTLLTPVAAQLSFICVIFIRTIMGMAEGTIQPCIAATIARWIPPDERSSAIAIYTAGSQLCMTIGMPLFAALCGSQDTFLGGWPSIFYIAAATALPWCVAWIYFITNAPQQNKRISEDERNFIALKLKDQSLRRRQGTKMPWRGMLTSRPVWACNVSNFASSMAVFTLQAYLPTYFKEVLSLDLKQNGFYSSLPFLIKWFVKMAFGWTADNLKQRGNFNRTTVCKVFNSIGCYGCAVFFIACSFLDCNHQKLALFFLCLATGLSSGYVPGALTSAASLAPHYSGSVRSWSGLFNQLAGLVAPYVVMAVNVHGTREEWQIVFFTVSSVLIFAGTFFNIFGSAEIQPWGRESHVEDPSQRPMLVLNATAVQSVEEKSPPTDDPDEVVSQKFRVPISDK